MEYQYLAIVKPFGYLSQFTQEKEGDLTLSDLLDISKNIYPIGRLDKDSEGLLLLTNDNHFKNLLLKPESEISKIYLVQVEGEITEEAISKLNQGVIIKLTKISYKTKPARVNKIEEPTDLPSRNPPIRFRKNIPTSWIEISISEGKNRQIRKMCATVGFPVLRLIRIAIGKYKLNKLEFGKLIVLKKSQII